MIETFVDFAVDTDIATATTKANEAIKRNEDAGWNMIQSQLMICEKTMESIYSMVFQRTKEVKARQQFEFGGEHEFKEQAES